MAIEDYYHDLTVQGTAQGVDEYGSPATVPAGEPRTVRGYIGEPSSKQQQRAAQRGIDVAGRLYAPLGAAVAPFDVITDDNGRSYQVASQPRDAARRGHHVEADLTEWRWGNASAE